MEKENMLTVLWKVLLSKHVKQQSHFITCLKYFSCNICTFLWPAAWNRCTFYMFWVSSCTSRLRSVDQCLNVIVICCCISKDEFLGNRHWRYFFLNLVQAVVSEWKTLSPCTIMLHFFSYTEAELFLLY